MARKKKNVAESVNEGNQGNQEEEKLDIKKEIFSWIKTFVVAILLVIFITQVLIVNARIPSESMENTIMVGDRLIASRLAYKFDEPKRCDIVVFPNPDDESELYIKRIIGMPGETISGKDGLVYINGEPLQEDYIKEPAEDDFGPFEIPENCYFMMGDNRNNSLDSRYWEHTYLKGDKILGKASFQYFPQIKKVN